MGNANKLKEIESQCVRKTLNNKQKQSKLYGDKRSTQGNSIVLQTNNGYILMNYKD